MNLLESPELYDKDTRNDDVPKKILYLAVQYRTQVPHRVGGIICIYWRAVPSKVFVSSVQSPKSTGI